MRSVSIQRFCAESYKNCRWACAAAAGRVERQFLYLGAAAIVDNAAGPRRVRQLPVAGSSGTLFEYRGDASLAILASVGEIDPLGTRRDGLAAFLNQKVEEGYVIETRTDTHAIISRRPKGLRRFTSGADPGRYVVEVDEDGIATMRPAEARRT
jgi:hypothetical protein